MKPAPLFAVALALGAAEEPLALALEEAPVKLISFVEISNPVVEDAKLTPLPLTHELLVPGAPTVKFTPAHYPSARIVR